MERVLINNQPGNAQRNLVLHASKDVNDAVDIRLERTRKGQFKVLGVIDSILFEPDRAFNPTTATADAKRVGRRLHWPEGGPWLARSDPDGYLLIPYGIALPLPDVPDQDRDDPARLPFGDNSDPAKHAWKPGDAVNTVPMMKQQMERVASAKFRGYLVFQPVAQIQLVKQGQASAGAGGMMGATQIANRALGSAQFASVGSHRAPVSSLTGADGTTMSLLVDPKNGEAFFLFGRYNGVDLKG